MLKLAFCLALALACTHAYAIKDYQVTGPVLEITPSKIVIQKGRDKWEIARDANTQIDGTPAVGEKVTVHYSMNAIAIDEKTSKKSK